MRSERARAAHALQPGIASSSGCRAQDGRIGQPLAGDRRTRQARRKRARIEHLPRARQARLEPGWQHRRQRRADGCAVIRGNCLGQDEQVRGQHRPRHDRLDLLEIRLRRSGLAFHHVAERDASPVWHQDQGAGCRHIDIRWHAVAERALGTIRECVNGHAHHAIRRTHAG